MNKTPGLYQRNKNTSYSVSYYTNNVEIAENSIRD